MLMTRCITYHILIDDAVDEGDGDEHVVHCLLTDRLIRLLMGMERMMMFMRMMVMMVRNTWCIA